MERRWPLRLPTGRAICYSGYRDGQSPDARIFPSAEEIRADLQLLLPHFHLLRLYDCTPHAERVLAVIRAEHLPFRVLLGAWLAAEESNPGCPWGGLHAPEQLAANFAANEAQVARLIALANEYPDIVFAVAVGNEAAVDWTDHRVPVARILSLVQRVRQAVAQPVTVCDNYVPWHDALAPVAAAVDFLSLHSYPVWESVPIERALSVTQDNLAALARRYPDLPVAITEAGWTTCANGRGIAPGQASESLQETYLRALFDWTDAAGVLCFVFEAFDEPWKGAADPLEPEKHWGLYTSDRQPKQAVRNGVLASPRT